MMHRRALAVFVVLTASIACHNDSRPLPRSHEWAEKPEDEFRAGQCGRALQTLHEVPLSERDAMWWQMFEDMSTTCLYREKNESYRASLLKEFAEAEPTNEDDPSFLFWYAVGLERVGQPAAASTKYLAAERAARRTLATSSDEDARYHASVVLENITRNRQGPAPKPTVDTN